MPKRTDIHSILIIGSGPIVIGQGCEFDYSGVQACRALREEGYRVVLINSNPATIMTDPEFADATYIEPISPEAVEKILAYEKANGTPVDALLPTLGGQTGLNTGMACYDRGILQKYGVQMIGADRDAIHRGEDRQVFKDLMIKIGLKVPRSGVVHNLADARQVLADIGLPLIIRPAFTLGGTGGGIAYNVEEFERIVQGGIDASPVNEVLIEQSVIGWKEYEMEVMRDKNDNVVIICSIENIDAMGVHTGDSITVAPIQTLTDKEYQRMRDASIAIIRAVGVETGGSNIQFGINPENGDMIVIEMNPRVSRSSALASKATGYPIAKLAAKLAVGYTLDELPNYITSRRFVPVALIPSPGTPGEGGGEGSARAALAFNGNAGRAEPSPQPSPGVPGEGEKASASPQHSAPGTQHSDWDLYTSACFEPTIDYCVIKIPRWTFEKFPDADETLTTQMKSVGEAMAIGRTFKEALQKGIRSMEVKRFGFGLDKYDKWLNAQKKGNETGRDEGNQGAEGGARSTGVSPVSSANKDHGRDARATGDDSSDKTTQGESLDHEWPIPDAKLTRKLAVPSQGRLYYVRYAMKMGWTIERIHELTKIDPWFLAQMKQLVEFETQVIAVAEEARRVLNALNSSSFTGLLYPPPLSLRSTLATAKQWGYSDVQLAAAWGVTATDVRRIRWGLGQKPVYKLVDTCAAEFEASTPYYYSSYETPYTVIRSAPRTDSAGTVRSADPTDISRTTKSEDEIRLTTRPKVIIIGGGPNRIGQGIEFDYCCVQAAFAAKELGLESVMINSNPETVSTDYDTSDLLFFEPLTHEDILNICERLNGGPFARSTGVSPVSSEAEKDEHGRDAHATKNLVLGVIVQFGGQTPLNLAKGLKEAGVPILGTTVESLDAAGDREQFRALLQQLGQRQPENGIARSVAEAKEIAKRIGYPVLVRPSFVLGGRAMEIVSDESQLNYYMANAVDASTIVDAPILVDKFLDAATEVDVDCIADFDPGVVGSAKADPTKEVGQAIIIGVMEHIEEAGIHSGDSACSLPPHSLPADIVLKLKQQTRDLAKALRVRGLMNVQYAIKDGEIYVIEVNPRASRTVPFVSKATGVPWAKIAAKVMTGKSLAELGVTELPPPKHTSVKEVVFPFSKFPGVDVILGPEMRSTGEVMGIDDDFPTAYAKAQMAAGGSLPLKGNVFVSVREADKADVVPVAKKLAERGFTLLATSGTFEVLRKNDIPATRISKLAEGRPNIRDFIKNGQIQLIINTPTKKGPQTDEGKIRAMAVLHKVPMITTITGASAAAQAIAAMQAEDWGVRPLQTYFAGKYGEGEDGK